MMATIALDTEELCTNCGFFSSLQRFNAYNGFFSLFLRVFQMEFNCSAQLSASYIWWTKLLAAHCVVFGILQLLQLIGPNHRSILAVQSTTKKIRLPNKNQLNQNVHLLVPMWRANMRSTYGTYHTSAAKCAQTHIHGREKDCLCVLINGCAAIFLYLWAQFTHPFKCINSWHWFINNYSYTKYIITHHKYEFVHFILIPFFSRDGAFSCCRHQSQSHFMLNRFQL